MPRATTRWVETGFPSGQRECVRPEIMLQQRDDHDAIQDRITIWPFDASLESLLFRFGSRRLGLDEVVAADRLGQRIQVARYGGNAGPTCQCSDVLRLHERAEDRQRQVRVAAFDRAVEPVGKLPLP